MPSPESINDLPLTTLADVAHETNPSAIEREVIALHGQFRDSLLRYALSLGLPVYNAEEVIQELFLSLFQHLQLRRSQANLRGWLFRVTHNLGLKQLRVNQRAGAMATPDWATAKEQLARSPDPEEELLSAQRHHRLQAVVQALPENDRHCLRLRAEGPAIPRNRNDTLMSLGAVSISLT
jgi:RNA polymerase sigma-70 factor, ECF subfamily